MGWRAWARQIHRWLSVVFTVCVIANVVVNFVLSGQDELALWVGLFTLVPLFLLLFSGVYLFVLPYATKWRIDRRTE